MNWSSGHWHVVLSSRELGTRPVGCRRFGERLVFWRDANGEPACARDRCPHRGSALSLGSVNQGAIVCPYHGFEFQPDGRCTRVPPEGTEFTIPTRLRVPTQIVRESQGFVWLWRGPAVPSVELPAVPVQPGVDGLVFDECRQTWPAHFTRCVEGVIDHSHLPFVHRRTLGRLVKDPTTRIRIDEFDGGFRANLMLADGRIRHHVDFSYPNVWTQRLAPNYAMSCAFAPIDERSTEVYCRIHHRLDNPLLRPFMRLWCRFGNWLVFHEDQPVLDSQRPRSADEAVDERLVPSDSAVLAFRKLRAMHRAEKEATARLASGA